MKKWKILIIITILISAISAVIIYLNNIERKYEQEGIEIAEQFADRKIVQFNGEQMVEITQTVNSRSGTTYNSTVNFYGEKCIKSVQNITTGAVVTKNETSSDWKNVSMNLSGEKTTNYQFKITMASGLELRTSFSQENLFPSNNTPPSKPEITVQSRADYERKAIKKYKTSSDITITAESYDLQDDAIEYIWEGRNAETAKYEAGEHTIRVKAVDIYGAESEWEECKLYVLSSIYAALYTDNTLRLSNNENKLLSYRNLQTNYGDVSDFYGNNWCWDNDREEIEKVIIEDKIVPENMNRMFAGLSNISTVENLENIDVSCVEDMSGLFFVAENLVSIAGIENWKTDNVTDMSYIFSGCTNLNDFDKIRNWNVANVTDMSNMFNGCKNITTMECLEDWDVSKVTNMSNMFCESNITSTNGLERWNTCSVTNMFAIFRGCNRLNDLDALSNWNIENVEDISFMFAYCTGLASIEPIANWNTGSVTNLQGIFTYCTSLTIADLSNWNTRNNTSLYSVFFGCSNLVAVNLANWDTSLVTRSDSMFTLCNKLKTIYVTEGKWNMGRVTDSQNMFYECTSLVGGNGTKYNSRYIDKTHARVDKSGTPGYLTAR